MKKLNCLVTGASSGIGKEISIELSAYAKHIYICSRNVQKLEIVHDKIIENTYLVNEIQNQYDLNHMVHIMNLIYEISNNKIEVWHLAANSDILSGIKNSNIDFKNTFLTTFNLLEACKEYGIKSFYFASSSFDHFP